ncbi:hypothetical protein [Polaromonas aquatica]|uniref:hypothetical protein n=1 Tax=Polaromonas aquatica TaxID=332657 RepID=UPI003D64F15E
MTSITPTPEFTVNLQRPAECDLERLAIFQALVLEGGEVNPATLPQMIGRAPVLAFLQSDQLVVGVGGIKRPYDSHRSKVFAQSKANSDPAIFEFELGWIYLRPVARSRHQVSPLIRALMVELKAAPVYATSRVNNDRMHTALKNCGFTPDGNPYPSKLNEPFIQLFVRK